MGQGAYILAPAGPRLEPAEADFFRDADPWGFILFARNCETPDQLRRLTDDLRGAVGRDAPIFIDQEGGRVQRLGPPHWRQWLPPLDEVARAGSNAVAVMACRHAIIAAELRAVGIDGNCVPSGDIAHENTHAFLRNRCYGHAPEPVAAIAMAVAEASLEGGVLPVVKHIPGHGRAAADSHLEPPRVDAPAEELEREDFAVFRALAGYPLGMTAHVVFTAYDDRPATISPDMIRLIREDIGFAGALMTDDISMEALGGPVEARAEAALAAGCDLVLHCNGNLAEMAAVAARAGMLSGASEARTNQALNRRRSPSTIDFSALEAEFESLIEGAANA